MDALPADDLQFTWRFNTSTSAIRLPQEDISVHGTMSRLEFTPLTELDYGTFLCWAANSIGRGKPCSFRLVPSGPPEPPTGCVTNNFTYSSFTISCDPLDKTVNLTLNLKVHIVGTDNLVKKIDSAESSLEVGDLLPGTAYTLLLRRENRLLIVYFHCIGIQRLYIRL